MKKSLNKYQYPFYTMFHPDIGFDGIKYHKKISVLMSIVFVALFSLLLVVEKQYQGPQFDMVAANETNILMSVLLAFGGMLLFTISNWAFCVFLEGKANFKEIWVITSYSLLPYTLCGYIRVLLSNFLTREEEMFLIFITVLGIIWSFVMLMSAFINFHQYELSRAVLALVLTVIGMAICICLIFLMYSLVQQLIGNAATVYNEILFRIREG